VISLERLRSKEQSLASSLYHISSVLLAKNSFFNPSTAKLRHETAKGALERKELNEEKKTQHFK
jgi:hypothetical protein